MLFNLKPSFSADTLELHAEPDKSKVLNYTDAAFTRFIITDLEVMGSGTIKGGFDEGFSIQPSSGYTATVVISGVTGALGDIPATVVLDGTANDRLSRNGNDGKYTLTQGGETKTGGERGPSSPSSAGIHYVQITSVEVQEEEEEEEEEIDVIVAQDTSGEGLPMAVKVGIPVGIGLVVFMMMMK